MGIAGSIAGPLFNLLIGLGTVLIKQIIQNDYKRIDFYLFSNDKEDIIILFSIVILILNLFRIIIQCIFLKYTLKKSVGLVGYLIFLTFLSGIIFYIFFYN
jgi:hypothetical protein